MPSSVGEHSRSGDTRGSTMPGRPQLGSENSYARKRHTSLEPTSQVEEWHGQIALEEYLSTLDTPAAILLCGTERDSQHSTLPSTSATIVPSTPPAGHVGASRPPLVRVTSSAGSSWPTTYGSTGSSNSMSSRIPTQPADPSPASRTAEAPTTLNQCRFVWGNRYMSVDIEEMLMNGLQKAGLLQRAWSRSSRNSQIYTSGSTEPSSWRRVAWKVTALQDGRYLTLIAQEETQDSNFEHEHREVRTETTTSFPKWLDVPGLSEEARQHRKLFVALDWASTPLGPLHQWSPSLVCMVNVCMSSPFPMLLSWGPEMILLYNHAYGAQIGAKHPAILGMRYDVAWSEVWAELGPVVAGAMNGHVVHVDNAQMFLKRGNFLEETYFTWSMIPARGPTGSVEGLVIPNFDNTSRIISERRIQTLNVLSRAIAESRSAEQIASIALPAFENNIDVPFMVVYLASPAEELHDHELSEQQSQRTRSTTDSSRRLSTTSEDLCLEFELAGYAGCISIQKDDPNVPSTVISDRSIALDQYDDSHGLTKYIRMAHCHDDAVVISTGSGLRDILPDITPNAFGDFTTHVAVMPIRSSSEDRTHGVIVIGLNTRIEFTEPYKDYINTMRGLFATGLASVKLHKEQMARAQYLAALNRRKNDELQVLLKKKTEELRSAELKMSTAFDCCPTGIWIANENLEIVFLNPAYYQITGLHPDAPLSSWIDLVHPDDMERVTDIFSKCRQQRCKAEFRVLTGDANPDGSPALRWVESIAGPQYDSIGQVCGTIMDITLRKEREEYQVRRAEDALERKRQQEYFIDMTSHELRNPLSAICLAVEGIVERLDTVAQESEPSVQVELRDLMKDHEVVNLCTQHMKRLIDDVLSLSKLDSDMLVVTSVVCRPLKFTRDVLGMFEPELRSKSISYSFSVLDGYRSLVPSCVKVDPQRVTQVLINLLTNAIKFTSMASTRRITCSLDASQRKPHFGSQVEGPMTGDSSTPDTLYLIWSVQDTGPGVSEEESSRLFKRFQQAQPRTHVTYGGSGLGLFISKKLTNLLGGDIYLKSEPGFGSTFTFFVQAELSSCPPDSTCLANVPSSNGGIPVATVSSTTSSTAEAKSATTKRKLRVLLIEDNLINQQLLQRQLIKAGCSVAVANNGQEALDLVVEGKSLFDCILMDVEMPIMGGLECTREIRRRNFDVPIIAVTANARSEQVQEIIACGMDAAVAKPFSTADLMKQMWQLVMAREAAEPSTSSA